MMVTKRREDAGILNCGEEEVHRLLNAPQTTRHRLPRRGWQLISVVSGVGPWDRVRESGWELSIPRRVTSSLRGHNDLWCLRNRAQVSEERGNPSSSCGALASLVRLPTQSSRRLVGPGGDFDAARRSNARSRVSRHSGGDQIISKSLTNPSPLLRGKSSYAVSSRCVGSADYAIRNGLSTRAVCAHTQHMACGVRRVDTADVHGHEWHHTCTHTRAAALGSSWPPHP